MKLNRTKILNHIIEKAGLTWYLEIGLGGGGNFRAVTAPSKISVDPVDRGFSPTFQMKSDDFFTICPRSFDLIFIDGLHHQGQFLKDVENSLRFLNPGGFIVCHDINPISETHQHPHPEPGLPWNGDIWKAWVRLRCSRPDLEMTTFDCDHGIGIITRGHQKTLDIMDSSLTYEQLARNRKVWLNLRHQRDFGNWIDEKIDKITPDLTLSDRPKLILYVRTNLNWSLINQHNFLKQEDQGRQIWAHDDSDAPRTILQKIKIWDECFNIPYFGYRKRMQQIAEKSWLAIDQIDGIIRDSDLLFDILERNDAIVLPTDDDDWFHPRLSEMLLAVDFERLDVATWQQLRYLPATQPKKDPQREKIAVSDSPFLTNNYCLTSNLFKKVEREQFLVFARRHSRAKKGNPEFLTIPSVLSGKNNSQASISNLYFLDKSKVNEMRTRFRLPMQQLPNEGVWAKQYINSMEMLNSKL